VTDTATFLCGGAEIGSGSVRISEISALVLAGVVALQYQVTFTTDLGRLAMTYEPKSCTTFAKIGSCRFVRAWKLMACVLRPARHEITVTCLQLVPMEETFFDTARSPSEI